MPLLFCQCLKTLEHEFCTNERPKAAFAQYTDIHNLSRLNSAVSYCSSRDAAKAILPDNQVMRYAPAESVAIACELSSQVKPVQWFS